MGVVEPGIIYFLYCYFSKFSYTNLDYFLNEKMNMLKKKKEEEFGVAYLFPRMYRRKVMQCC
jgi:hypothetical protein